MMKSIRALKTYGLLAGLILSSARVSHATSLSLGADYLLRGVANTERDRRFHSDRYYDQQLQAYLTTDLSRDVEASIRVQSITPWGLEGSTTPLRTRYPNANGNLFVQNAYARLPHIWKDHLIMTVGRQPIQWGDGKILADDDLGFDAIRAQVKSPFRRIPFDLEGFTAKISEGLNVPNDTDLHGAMLSFDSRVYHWEMMGLWDNSNGDQSYVTGSSTIPFQASKVQRVIYGVRAITRVRDAYIKGEYYRQAGTVKSASASPDVKLGGTAFLVGVGGKQNTSKFGRFGAVLEYSEGSGDDATTPTKDESFRAPFASRWSGLERKGYGRYFAANFSDAYSPSDPFAPASAANSGLPAGVSGIQTVHFGIDSTPWSQWTFSVDYFQYKGQRSNGDLALQESAVTGLSPGEGKELGTEFDYGFEYRYSGLVTVRGSINVFSPGAAFAPDTQQKAQSSNLELSLKF
jgi:hypothetical protein